MIKKTKKPTNKEMMRHIAGLAVQIEQLRARIHMGDKALDEYMKMKGDKEEFVKYLEENYNKDDQDNKKTESK